MRYIRKREADEGYSQKIALQKYKPLDIAKAKHPPRRMRTSYASGCADGGEDVYGADMAGLEVVFAWDKKRIAAATLDANFRNKDLHVICEDQIEALAIAKTYRVDILHLSWPCQSFSPACTTEGGERWNRNAELSLGSGLLPLVTILDGCGDIPADATLHE
jgi:hypothetical protein